MSSTPTIPEFYAGQSVFMTGATGFMGKILLEKLLRSCPDVKRVYLLIRPKKGKESQERLDELLDSKLFDKMKAQNPDFRSKCVPVEGDIVTEGLGISQSDEDTLIKEVSVVFHSAATIKFDEQMKLSVEMNIVGVKSMIELSKKMRNLAAFIHISTAYSNCDQKEIKEEIYPPPLQPKQLLGAVEWMDAETLDTLTPKMVGDRPNTYTFTKAIAEYLLYEESQGLPVAIFRPSIVGATYLEPVRGWVDNVNGPTGLLAAIGKGVLRIMKGDSHATADIIPADLATNMLLAVGWYTGVHRPDEMKVFNCTSGQINQYTWGNLERMSYEYFMKNPLNLVARIPNPRFTKNALWHDMNVAFDHMLPAYLMDFYMWVLGRRRMFVRIQDKLWKAVGSLSFFTSHSWKFSNENLFMLNDILTEEDRKVIDTKHDKVVSSRKLANITLQRLTTVSDNEFALNNGYEIDLYSVTDRIKLTRTIQTSVYVRGLLYTNNMFIISTGSTPSSVFMVNMNGDILKTFPTELDGQNLFKYPAYIAVNRDQTAIYVSDCGKKTVTCLTFDGEVKSQYKYRGQWSPRGVAVSRDGLVYVCDSRNNNIHILSPDLKEVGKISGKKYKLREPRGLAYCDKEHKLYVGMLDQSISMFNI